MVGSPFANQRYDCQFEGQAVDLGVKMFAFLFFVSFPRCLLPFRSQLRGEVKLVFLMDI